MDDRKKQILEVSLSLFLEKGYDKTSINDILAKLDIARGTLYYHFPSKEAIMDAIIEESSRKIFTEAENISRQKELSVYEKLFFLFFGLNMKRISGGDLMLDYLNHPQNALFHEKSNAILIEKITPLLGEIIREGREQNLFDNTFPYETAEMILILVIGFLDARYPTLDRRNLEHRMRALVYTVERILGVEKGSFDSFADFALWED